MIFADKIMEERRRRGWSQEQLADKLGVTRQSVSKWESGSSVPELPKIIQLSDLFGISVDYLVKDAMDTDLWKESIKYKEKDDAGRGLEEKVEEIHHYLSGYSYTSKRKIWGIPLVSIRFTKHMGKDCAAKGIIAIGSLSVGVVSIGGVSVGLISLGGVSVGAAALGGVALGLVSFGAVAVGLVSFGLVSLGIYALGITAVGKELAAGLVATGKNAIGAEVKGVNCLQTYPGITGDVIKQFLQEHCPGLWKPVVDMVGLIGRNN